jgi:hypothetical protein
MMPNCSTLLPWMLLFAVSGGVQASAFHDYGGFAKYKRSLADGGGCISGMVGTTVPGKNFNVSVNYAGHQYTDEAQFNLAYFGFTTLDKKHDIDDGKLRASAFMLCLEPGEYDIVGVEMRMMTSTQRIRMPFRVDAGKNYYLGRLIFHNGPATALSCGNINPDAVEIMDAFEDDLPHIMKRKGAIAPESRLLDARLGLPYFFSCPS